MDLKVYRSFESCPVGGWYESAELPVLWETYAYSGVAFKLDELSSNRVVGPIAENIISLLSLAQDGEKWREMDKIHPPSLRDEIRIDGIQPHTFDATIRDCAAGIVEAIGIHCVSALLQEKDRSRIIDGAFDKIADRLRGGKE